MPWAEVCWALHPEWADTLLVQVQSRRYYQPVFWPAKLSAPDVPQALAS